MTQHAMWHFANWCLWSNPYDKVAWQSIAKLIGQEERHRLLSSLGGKIGGKIGNPANKGKNWRREDKVKAGKIQSSQKWKCLVTGMVSTAGPLTRYQRKRGIDTSLRIQIS